MTIAGRIRTHWFLALLPALLLVEAGFARSTDWSSDRLAEAAILFDLCVFVPGLHWLAYRRRLALRALAIRTAALSLGGLYVASSLVPAEAQTMVADLLWARDAGWIVLALLELGALVLIVKLVFGGASTDEIAARTGVPHWAARIMQIEARFWKWLLSRLRR